ncbi:MAG: hypothetical protein KBS85_05255 [Lachnospiraceae bacterium]|nr:hypothetical protein [Candidatus Merdinaster equi]
MGLKNMRKEQFVDAISYMKAVITIVFCAFLLVGLTACKDIDGDLADKRTVEKKVAEIVPEAYEYVSVQHITDSQPKKDVYTYRSLERDLIFEVVSTLAPIGIDASTIGYEERINVNYADAVHNLYMDEAKKILSEIKTHNNDYYYESYEELEQIARIIVSIDDIYKQEEEYNTKEWMSKNPLMNIRFRYRFINDAGNESYYSVFGENIDGSLNYEDEYEYITYRHVQAVADGQIIDASIPEAEMERAHVLELGSIICDGVDLSQKAYEDANRNGLTNNSENLYHSYYYKPWDTYVVALDLGLTSDEYAPRWMEAFSNALGYRCKVKDNLGQVELKVNGTEWVIQTTEEGNGRVFNVEFYKDGSVQDIHFITSQEESSPVWATYLVCISVEDFADIFDVFYTVDEDAGKLIITSK